MSNLSNGNYILISGDSGDMGKRHIVQYVGQDVEKAIQHMSQFIKQNNRPNAWLAQIVATSEYPPPEIKTLAHERMV